jgi:hypothetical protein
MKHMYTWLGIGGVSKKFKGKLDQIVLWSVSTMLILGTLIFNTLPQTRLINGVIFQCPANIVTDLNFTATCKVLNFRIFPLFVLFKK